MEGVVRYTNKEFWNNKNVFITGHTGFKGSWLSFILTKFGANVTGYSLNPPTRPNLFDICNINKKTTSIIGDIRDKESLQTAFETAKPEIVFHMAAQPLVRESYLNPVYTYETNVLGTVNILECVRNANSVKSVVNVTTDKVYENKEWSWGYRENDVLNGYDPYSNSKSCSELVTDSYKKSFLDAKGIAVSTVRAGNVIGGGDFAADRIIPDCVRAAINSEKIIIRNPNSIRPYQHVLEALFAYLMIAEKQHNDAKYADCYNIGADDSGCVTTGRLVELLCKKWGQGLAFEIRQQKDQPHEANFLKLDCSKVKQTLNWRPFLTIEEAVEETVEWTKVYLSNGDLDSLMEKQVFKYMV